MGSTPPRGWFLLEHRYYERSIVYPKLEWGLTAPLLSQAIAAFAPCGGPVAIVPDYGWAFSGAACTIYTVKGRLVKQYQRVRELSSTPFRTVALGWSRNDVLTIVHDDGGVVRIRIGEIDDVSKVVHILKHAEEHQRIHDATVLSSGDVVARTVSGEIYRLSTDDSVVNERVKITPPQDSNESFPRVTILGIAPELSALRDIETVVIANGGALFKITSAGAQQLTFSEPISQVTVSAHGKFMAFVVAGTTSVVVSNMDLSEIHVRVDLGRKLAGRVEGCESEPKRIKWVGSDCVAAFYNSAVVLIGPNEQVTVIDVDNESSAENVLAFTEADGLRMLSATKLEFIRKVNPTVAALLCDEKDAGFKLLRGSGAPVVDFRIVPNASACDPLTRYELVSELRDTGKLRDAARSCAAAALLMENPDEQKALLRATTYAHWFDLVLHKKKEDDEEAHSSKLLESRDSHAPRRHIRRKQKDEELVPNAVTALRVINAVRSDSIGIPLTKVQLDELGESALISRLSMYGEHSTAVKLALYTDESTSSVLEKWAVAVIRDSDKVADGELTNTIVERFEAVQRLALQDGGAAPAGRALPYVGAAKAAFTLKRRNCAETLLQREHRPAPKVAMYLKMGREGNAISAAVESSNPELVLDVLGKVARRRTTRETARDTARLFGRLKPAIGNRAVDLLVSHLRQLDEFDPMRVIYLETGRVREAALLDISVANRIEDDDQRAATLEKIAKNIWRGRHRTTCQFEVQCAQHAADVAKCAKEVEKKAGLARGTLSRSNDTELLRHAIHGIEDGAKRREMVTSLRRELRIPERRFFWVCLNAMAEAGDFETIEALSNSAGQSRPPPIGLMPFVDACLRYKQEEEAKKYAERISDLRSKARALARCGYGKEATVLALRLRNPQLQEEIAELVSLHANALAS